MEKKLLITVSADTSHLYGVRFACSFFRNKSAVSITLLYVAPNENSMGKRTGRGQIGRNAGAEQDNAQLVFEAARQKLLDCGFAAENVGTRSVPGEFGTARHIIREARSGRYDAVVLGKRGYLLFESILSTSVTKQILDQNVDIPIWICKRPDENRRNVLLCVDGSAASLRMADHIGFILADETDHSVTLFHVNTGDGSDNGSIMSEAERLITSQAPGVKIESILISSLNTGVAKKILEQAEANMYAVVAVGRVGIEKGRLKEWLIGSRTMKLLESIDKSALWVSR